ncbi:MAG: hypothetical protein IMF09_10330 [Proteobacteria bacterium]|nr:hypothetical protein [Pseudomonadota bacterium]
MTNNRWGCPNWKDRESYPHNGDDLSDALWRWEFIRRDPDYRQAWARGTEAETPLFRIPALEDQQHIQRYYCLYQLYDPSKKGGFHETLFIQKGGYTTRHASSKDTLDRIDMFNKKFTDPAIQDAHLRSTIESLCALSDLSWDGKVSLAVFDLSKPLTEQFDQIKVLLKEQQKYYKQREIGFKKQKGKWPRYLRVIDAKDQGASYTEIFNHFAEETAGGDEDKLDLIHHRKSQPDATAMQLHERAIGVMEKAIRLL